MDNVHFLTVALPFYALKNNKNNLLNFQTWLFISGINLSIFDFFSGQ